jgi:hypothetical protein
MRLRTSPERPSGRVVTVVVSLAALSPVIAWFIASVAVSRLLGPAG